MKTRPFPASPRGAPSTTRPATPGRSRDAVKTRVSPLSPDFPKRPARVSPPPRAVHLRPPAFSPPPRAAQPCPPAFFHRPRTARRRPATPRTRAKESARRWGGVAGSGERARLACWRRRPAFADFLRRPIATRAPHRGNPPRCLPCADHLPGRGVREVRFGGTPKPARGTRALPGDSTPRAMPGPSRQRDFA